MVLYYALGGGLGHLVRARKVLASLGLASDRAAILTASAFARDPRVTGALTVIEVPSRLDRDRAAFARWLDGVFATLHPDALIVDSFPGGILGELCGMTLPPAQHVARRLRWPAYAPRLTGPLPTYDVTYILEPLSAPHRTALDACSARAEPLELDADVAMRGPPLIDGVHWLVIHSGPDGEVLELTRYAHELRATEGARAQIVIVTPDKPSWLLAGAQWHDVHPAAPHAHHAERIITAAGFNAMHELAWLRPRHEFIPFPRPLDDQFARAAAWTARAQAQTQKTIVRPSWAMTRSSR